MLDLEETIQKEPLLVVWDMIWFKRKHLAIINMEISKITSKTNTLYHKGALPVLRVRKMIQPSTLDQGMVIKRLKKTKSNKRIHYNKIMVKTKSLTNFGATKTPRIKSLNNKKLEQICQSLTRKQIHAQRACNHLAPLNHLWLLSNSNWRKDRTIFATVSKNSSLTSSVSRKSRK